MITEIEKKILIKAGWVDNQLNFNGALIYDIETKTNKPIAKVVSKLDDKEILIQYSVPDLNGEIINLYFNRQAQDLDLNKTDREIINNKDFDVFLDMVENTVRNQKGMFLATKKHSMK